MKAPLRVDLTVAGRIAGRERPAAYEPPPAWTPEHVDVRLTEAFEVLMCLPGTTGPKRHGTAMPRYIYEAADIEAQREIEEFSIVHKRLSRQRGAPSLSDVTRMEEALQWPLRFLKDESNLAKAVAWSSFRKAVKREDGKLHHALSVSRRTFFRYRVRGLQIIAHGLNSQRTPVT